MRRAEGGVLAAQDAMQVVADRGLNRRCSVCREIDDAPIALLFLYIGIAWTPFRPARMVRFLDGHDFGCEERFKTYG